jgi:HEPN domain-containing protein
MVDRRIIDEWLVKAEEDFRFAKIVLTEEKEYYDQICFHFQQSAEKYLKAFIIANHLGFEKTHDLPLLLQKCIGKDPAFAALKNNCGYLTAFYIQARYPIELSEETTKDKAQRAMEAASDIRDLVRSRLIHT